MFSAETIERARALAQRDDSERKDLERFIDAMVALVSRRFIPHGGQVLALGQYLDDCERYGSSGDEQPVVDELTRDLLRALGYQPGDFSYNLPLAHGAHEDRPDFTVRVPEFLGNTPLFVIEDKSTHVRDLGKQIDGESPRGQLRRYVQSGKVHGRVGLLVNGWRVEGWEFGGDGDVCVVDLDLHEISRSSVTDAIRRHLQVLHSRFSRGAFALADNTAALLRRPKLSQNLIQQMNEGPLKQNDAAGLTALIEKNLEDLWREHAIDVSRGPESLVDALRGLIDLCVVDVEQQLDDAIQRHSVYLAAVAEESRQADLESILDRIKLYRPHFELSVDEYDGLCLTPLRDWAKRPGTTAQRLHDEVIGSLDAHWKTTSAKKKSAKAFQSEIVMFTRNANACYVGREQLENDHRLAVRTMGAYQVWRPRVSSSVLVGKSEETYRSEFARQTAYVYVIRLLLVRICEDKGLFRRKLSDGGLVLWMESAERYLDYASGRSYGYLTRMAYDCANNVYLHFYGAADLFDWYRMDDKTLLRALAVLNAFNLERIDTDIIGAVYGRYLMEGKHEQGRYYTPEPVVETMLDMCGYTGGNVLDRKLLDPACGSGSFLVAACRRILSRFRDGDGEIPVTSLRPALEEVQRSLFGLDLNPFACYLAETNLLIQVLDLIRVAQRERLHLAVDRFHIYSADTLSVDEELGAADAIPILLLGTGRALPERMKARVEPFRDGFDIVVGNPPYVRADEEAENYLAYRRSVEKQRWFTTAYKKWDLYVPFIEQSLRLLSSDERARACLVTIESLGTAPYAEKIRDRLLQHTVLHDIAFCEDLKLFPDAAWQSNIIFSFAAGEPGADHCVRRWHCATPDGGGPLLLNAFDTPVQRQASSARIFSSRQEVRLDLIDTVRWEEICYVTKGMVLNSHEKIPQNAVVEVSSDYRLAPDEALVETLGTLRKRIHHRSFTRDDLVSETRDDIHTRRYLDSRGVLRGGIGNAQWLEYGAHTRCPERVSRPTFPELYDRSKVMFGTFTGVAVDEGKGEGFFVVSDSVRVSVRWSLMSDVKTRALDSARKKLMAEGRCRVEISASMSDWYLCALALSAPIQQWLHANKRSMKEHVYPDDIKAIPVKCATVDQQEPFVRLARERHQLWDEILELEVTGFRFGSSVQLPIILLSERFRAENAAKVRHTTLLKLALGGLYTIEPLFRNRSFEGARVQGVNVIVGREVALRVTAASEPERIANFLARYFGALPGIFTDHQDSNLLPAEEHGLLALADFLHAEECAAQARFARIEEIGHEIDALAWALYLPK